MFRKPRLMLVATHRDAYVGTTTDDPAAFVITLKDARQLVHWESNGLGYGLCGVAALGVNKHCRVSPAVPEITLRYIVAALPVSAEAAKTWEGK